MKSRTRKAVARMVRNCRPGQIRDASTGRCGPGVGIDVPRSQMPQIRGEHVEQFVDWAFGRGVLVLPAEVPADRLSPTQSHFDQERVDAIPDDKLSEPVVVSRDDRVLDGTHRWVKAWQRDKNASVPVLRVDLPARDALHLMRSFPGVAYAENRFVVNPFRSEAQRRFMYAEHPEMAKEWEAHTPKGRKLPRRVKKHGPVRNSRSVRPNRIDPTRTVTLRRLFVRKIDARYAALKQALVQLVRHKDVFGLQERKPFAFNAFCPTGEGGGIDDSCGSNEAGEFMGRIESGELDDQDPRVSEIGAALTDENKKMVARIDGRISAALSYSISKKGVTILHQIGSLDKGQGKKLIDRLKEGRSRIFAKTVRDEARGFYEKMGFRPSRLSPDDMVWDRSVTNTFCPTGPGGGVDPTCSSSGGSSGGSSKVPKFVYHQTTLQKWESIKKVGLKAARDDEATGDSKKGVNTVGDEDDLLFPDRVMPVLIKIDTSKLKGKKGSWKSSDFWHRYEGDIPPSAFSSVTIDGKKVVGNNLTHNTDWAYNPTPDQVKQFRQWLKQQLGTYVRGLSNDELWRRYVEQGFKKGAGRAFDDYQKAHPEIKSESMDFYRGSRSQFLQSSFAQPVAVDKVKLLAFRTFDELDNIDSDMSTKISRALTDGLVQGKGREDIARDIAKQVDIGRGRANLIAQTELIRAHAEGQLMALDELGVEELGVAVEWSTAGDDAVCDECEPLEGTVFTMEEAQGLIPRHVQCRCSWIPANVGENQKDQNRTRGEVKGAVKLSIEMGGKDWAGADKTIARDRPVGVVKNFSRMLKEMSTCPA